MLFLDQVSVVRSVQQSNTTLSSRPVVQSSIPNRQVVLKAMPMVVTGSASSSDVLPVIMITNGDTNQLAC